MLVFGTRPEAIKITRERFLQMLKLMRGITLQYAFCTEAAIDKLRRV